MSGGISAAAGTVAARHALGASISAALVDDDDVDITLGPSWPPTKKAWVAQQGHSTDTTQGPLGPNRSQTETLNLFIEVGAWVPGHDDATAAAAFDRAFGILDTIQTYIRVNDITLGGTVLWCIPGPSQSDGAVDEDGSGYYAVIAASFVATHRIRTGG